MRDRHCPNRVFWFLLIPFVLIQHSCSHKRAAYSRLKENNPYTENVQKRILPNGLTVLVKVRKTVPVATVMTHVKTGFAHNEDKLSGIPHVYEHLFFKGSKNYPNRDDIPKLISGLGGALNAWTSFEQTVYYFRLPSENVLKGLEIMADSIKNPLLDAKEIKKEIEVVIQEGRRRLDRPETFAWEKLKQTLFSKSRIRRWVIGQEKTLRKFDQKTMKTFHKNYYTPDISTIGALRMITF